MLKGHLKPGNPAFPNLGNGSRLLRGSLIVDIVEGKAVNMIQDTEIID